MSYEAGYDDTLGKKMKTRRLGQRNCVFLGIKLQTHDHSQLNGIRGLLDFGWTVRVDEDGNLTGNKV